MNKCISYHMMWRHTRKYHECISVIKKVMPSITKHFSYFCVSMGWVIYLSFYCDKVQKNTAIWSSCN